MATIRYRNTKYANACLAYIRAAGHACNAELLEALRQSYPELSATTIHRVTARLCERGEIARAPASTDGAMRYDGNLDEHHHFYCQACDRLRDIALPDYVVSAVENSLGGARLNGSLYIQGTCSGCSPTN